MSRRTAEELFELGEKLLNKEDFKRAERTFKAALELDDHISITNNLALALQKQNKTKKALETLKPHVDAANTASPGNPYSHALYAQLLAVFDRKEEARLHVDVAVKKFEKGLLLKKHNRAGLSLWLEYATIIMITIGRLGDHRRIMELYQRWKRYSLSDHARRLAAVASFNLGRYRSADTLWKSSPGNLTRVMRKVAMLIDRGDIPPFILDYESISHEELDKKVVDAETDMEARRLFAQIGQVRMMLLGCLLDAESTGKDVQMEVQTLVVFGGDWGREFGERILASNSYGKTAKLYAASALIQIGVYQESDPIPMTIDGQEEKVIISEVIKPHKPDQEAREILAEVTKLKEKGKIQEAIGLLENLIRKKKFYPRPLLVLADLYCLQGEWGKAEEILLLLYNVSPEDPVVLYNLTIISLEKGDIRKSRFYFNRLNLQGMDNEFKEKVKVLRGHIESQERELQKVLPFWNVVDAVDSMAESQRHKVEEKTLPKDAGLAKGLKNMPAIWLDGMLDYYDIDCSGKRQEKEKKIVNYLCYRDNLADTLEDLEEEDIEVIKFLLANGGWARLNIVSRKFGSMEGSGYFWNEDNPDLPLAFLWSIGLVMVGRTILNERRCKIATIPLDLREQLQSLL